jgi:hypothetical protein
MAAASLARGITRDEEEADVDHNDHNNNDDQCDPPNSNGAPHCRVDAPYF